MKRYYLCAPQSIEQLIGLSGKAGPLHWVKCDCHAIVVQMQGDAWADPQWASLGHLLDPGPIEHYCATCLGSLGVSATDSTFRCARKIAKFNLAFEP